MQQRRKPRNRFKKLPACLILNWISSSVLIGPRHHHDMFSPSHGTNVNLRRAFINKSNLYFVFVQSVRERERYRWAKQGKELKKFLTEKRRERKTEIMNRGLVISLVVLLTGACMHIVYNLFLVFAYKCTQLVFFNSRRIW